MRIDDTVRANAGVKGKNLRISFIVCDLKFDVLMVRKMKSLEVKIESKIALTSVIVEIVMRVAMSRVTTLES